ncbi:MAG: YchF/TatD family DNA exonuclease [Candidatus Omnitrophica bacterium]|nr:YchF/TatD family DNA exonuclease [Candidatus Omnitrophota bacterium]
MLIDTHCHLDDPAYAHDLGAVLGRAVDAGVGACLTIGTDVASSRRAVALAAAHPNVWAAVGIHPQDAVQWTDDADAALEALAGQPKVVAIGEVGLDYFREASPRAQQQAALRRALRLAQRRRLPVILHCRDAWGDLFPLLREARTPPIAPQGLPLVAPQGLPLVAGVLHCFTGDAAAATTALELGLTISFAGNLTFKNAEPLRAVARRIPIERMVVETDAPYLAPHPLRGQRNEPAHVTKTAAVLAELKGLSVEDVGRITSVNAHALFGIGPAPARGVIAYPIRDSLYLNLTNACTDRCRFCALSEPEFWEGTGAAPFVKGHHLRMPRDPTSEELIQAAGDPSRYREVVFCGYGEPTIRLQVLVEVARALKANGARRIRLDTNGHGNLIHQRSIVPDLAGLVDEVSVSLNTATAQQYVEICRPTFGAPTYEAIKTFIRECKGVIPSVTATVVAMPGVDVEACRRIAVEELGVQYRARPYDDVG